MGREETFDEAKVASPAVFELDRRADGRAAQGRPERARPDQRRALGRPEGPGLPERLLRVVLPVVSGGQHGGRVIDVRVARADVDQARQVSVGTIVETERIERLGRLHPQGVASRTEVDGPLVRHDGVDLLRLLERRTPAQDLREGRRRRRGKGLQGPLDFGQLHLLQVVLRLPQRRDVLAKPPMAT